MKGAGGLWPQACTTRKGRLRVFRNEGQQLPVGAKWDVFEELRVGNQSCQGNGATFTQANQQARVLQHRKVTETESGQTAIH